MEAIKDIFAWLITAIFVGALLALLYAIIRYSVISPFLTRGRSSRLRKPNIDGMRSLVGFAPAFSLVNFYRNWPHLEKTEYYLVDSLKKANWFIGAFMPLSKIDAREWINVSGKHGVPIATDMNKGTYFVTSAGAIELWSPNVEGGQAKVADSIEELMQFRAAEYEAVHPHEGL
jgi:hypothetical protein